MSEKYDKSTVHHIRELLLRGDRMLDEHCPKCGMPLILIKKVGLKYCPKCRVYIATEEEIKKAKIDTSKLKVYDFDEYWKGSTEIKVNETSKESPKNLMQTEIEHHPLVGEKLDELIVIIIQKISEKINKQELTVDQLIKLLESIIELKNQLTKL